MAQFTSHTHTHVQWTHNLRHSLCSLGGDHNNPPNRKHSKSAKQRPCFTLQC